MSSSASRKSDPQEPSMEDILASIRRILSEDVAAPADGPTPSPARSPAPAVEAEADDAEPRPTAERSAPIDAFDAPQPQRPSFLDDDADEEPPVSTLDEWADRSSEPDALDRTERPGFDRADPRADLDGVFMLTQAMRSDGQRVVSDEAADSSTDVLSKLARAILDRRDIVVSTRDVTLESMVREMLRPLLREWLDRNLPYLIERLVRKEIDLMVNRAERLED